MTQTMSDLISSDRINTRWTTEGTFSGSMGHLKDVDINERDWNSGQAAVIHYVSLLLSCRFCPTGPRRKGPLNPSLFCIEPVSGVVLTIQFLGRFFFFSTLVPTDTDAPEKTASHSNPS